MDFLQGAGGWSWHTLESVHMAHGALESWETSQGLPRSQAENSRRRADPQTFLSHSHWGVSAFHPKLEFSLGVGFGVKQGLPLPKGGRLKPADPVALCTATSTQQTHGCLFSSVFSVFPWQGDADVAMMTIMLIC